MKDKHLRYEDMVYWNVTTCVSVHKYRLFRGAAALSGRKIDMYLFVVWVTAVSVSQGI
jgi:hypothetical protein